MWRANVGGISWNEIDRPRFLDHFVDPRLAVRRRYALHAGSFQDEVVTNRGVVDFYGVSTGGECSPVEVDPARIEKKDLGSIIDSARQDRVARRGRCLHRKRHGADERADERGKHETDDVFHPVAPPPSAHEGIPLVRYAKGGNADFQGRNVRPCA
jgi:hypothetical protein